jgi:hypothetical protein
MFKGLFLALLLFATVGPALLAQNDAQDGGPPPGMRGVRGTVTAVSGTKITIKTDEGDVYQVLTSENTHIMKSSGPVRGGQQGPEGRQPIKVADVHVGDVLMTGGQVDAKAKTVGAVFVAVIDAEQAKKIREDLGKTWTAGEVTAIKDTTITIKRIDNVSQSFSVDENTSFRKRRDSITLGDIQVGDRVTAQGALKDGVFIASTVNVGRALGGPGGEGRGQGNATTSTAGPGVAPHNP